jgi:hypothetical protein
MLLHKSNYTQVFEDTTVCIKWANHVMGGGERAEHIDISKHISNAAVQNGYMRLYKIPTEFLADLLKKELQPYQFQESLVG